MQPPSSSSAQASASNADTREYGLSSSLSSLPFMLTGLHTTFGSAIMHSIQHTSRILVVGAGGIGCELIKNLALCGFRHVHVIDLDTIDVSNLNRQLLFRSEHVGMPKCTVACHVAKTHLLPPPPLLHTLINDESNNCYEYVAHHGNVCDPQFFTVPFVSQFDLVLTALDNIAARKRVNRLCLAATAALAAAAADDDEDHYNNRKNQRRRTTRRSVPLLEAGTTGYLGQVSVLSLPPFVACYECRPTEIPKVYPICTIRSTPSMPVHTIVWAKECYKLLFHPNVEESMLFEAESQSQSHPMNGDEDNNNNSSSSTATANVADAETTEDDDNAGSGEPSVYMASVLEYRKALASSSSFSSDSSSSSFSQNNEDDLALLARNILQGLYTDEINKQLAMNRFKTARKTPVPLPLDQIHTNHNFGTNTNAKTKTSHTKPPPSRSSESWSTRTTQIWTQQECIAEFVACLVDAAGTASSSLLSSNDGTTTTTLLPAEFDKDHDLAMRFVTAASNLRNYVFAIDPIQSYYSAKGIAGNIIPAIATTNAIVAGLQVLQAFHILKAQIIETLDTTESESSVNAVIAKNCRYINCLRQPSRNGLLLMASKLEAPNPNCYVCHQATVHVRLNIQNFTLNDFLDKIIKAELGFSEPAILIEDSIVYEEDEDNYVVNLKKRLTALPRGGIQHGTVLLVEDYSQDMSVELVISHCDDWPLGGTDKEAMSEHDAAIAKDPLQYKIEGSRPTVATTVEKSPTSTMSDSEFTLPSAKDNQNNNNNNSSEDEEIIEMPINTDKKRQIPNDNFQLAGKRRKLSNGESGSGAIENEVIEIN